MFGFFVNVADAGEVLQFAFEGFFVNPFIVPFFTGFNVGFDIDDDIVFDHLADGFAAFAIGGDERGDGGDGVILRVWIRWPMRLMWRLRSCRV